MTANHRLLREDEYLATWRLLEDRIFTGQDFHVPYAIKDNPFRESSWQVILLPWELHDGTFLFPEEELYESGEWKDDDVQDGCLLFKTLRDHGIEEFVISDERFWSTYCESSDTDPRQSWLCFTDRICERWDWPDFEHLFTDLFCAYSRDGNWCAISIHDPEYTVFGAAPEIMDAYLSRVGGLEAVKERFQFVDVSSGGLGPKVLTRDEVRQIYAIPGWEMPDLPEGYPHDPVVRKRIQEWGMRLGRSHPLYRHAEKER